MPKELGGYWWPDGDHACGPAILREVVNVEQKWLQLTDKRKVVVQAGGNCGVYARKLAEHFESVYTAEPDAENFVCFNMNVKAENVFVFRAAFGAMPGVMGIEKVPGNVGAHYMKPGGLIPVIRIDDLGLQACDLLALDVEGAEFIALQGAEKTIEQYRPVILTEDKGHITRFGQSPREMHSWLLSRGYRDGGFCARDRIWLP